MKGQECRAVCCVCVVGLQSEAEGPYMCPLQTGLGITFDQASVTLSAPMRLLCASGVGRRERYVKSAPWPPVAPHDVCACTQACRRRS